MFYGDVDGGDADHVEALGDAGDPVLAADGGQAEGDGFVERGGRDLDGVLDSVHVEEGYAAGSHGHGGTVTYSPCVRHWKTKTKGQKQVPHPRGGFVDDNVGNDEKKTRAQRAAPLQRAKATATKATAARARG